MADGSCARPAWEPSLFARRVANRRRWRASFSYEALALLRGGQVQRAGWYVLGTVMLALGATLAGSAVADELMRLGELGCLSTGNGGDGYGVNDERVLMRVHIGGRDRHRGKPQSQAIVGLLRERHYAGPTVLRFATRTGARPMRSI